MWSLEIQEIYFDVTYNHIKVNIVITMTVAIRPIRVSLGGDIELTTTCCGGKVVVRKSS